MISAFGVVHKSVNKPLNVFIGAGGTRMRVRKPRGKLRPKYGNPGMEKAARQHTDPLLRPGVPGRMAGNARQADILRASDKKRVGPSTDRWWDTDVRNASAPQPSYKYTKRKKPPL